MHDIIVRPCAGRSPARCAPASSRWLIGVTLFASLAGFEIASAAGAWQTFQRVVSTTDLLATSESLWVATGEAGLLLHDSTTQAWTAWRRDPAGIASNALTALARDPSGRLWVGTAGSGISRLAADGASWDRVDILDGLPVNSVTVLAAVGDTMWIGTTGGIALWNGNEISGSLPDPNTVSFDTTFSNFSINGIAQHGGDLWLSTPTGIGRARLSTGLTDWREENRGLLAIEPKAIVSDGVDLFALAFDRVYRYVDTVWVWTGHPASVHRLREDGGVVLTSGVEGVQRWNGSGWTTISGAPVFNATEPAIAPDGEIFVAFRDTVYQQTPTGPWARIPALEGPPNNDLINVDVDGPRVYVTTYDDGVGRFDGSKWRYWLPGGCGGGCDTTFRNPQYTFTLLVHSQGRKWIASWDQAIEHFDDLATPPDFDHHFIPGGLDSSRHTWGKAALEDRDGNVWIGMETNCKGCSGHEPMGLEYYAADGRYLGNFRNGRLVHDLAQSANGRIWVGYDGPFGAEFFTLSGDTTFVPLAETGGLTVRGVAVYGDSVWFLTPSSLIRFSTFATGGDNDQQTLSHPGGIAQLATRTLAVSANGTVWVATDAGLLAYHPGGGFEVFDITNSPLVSNEVRALRVDAATGALWIATAAGLQRYDPNYQPPPPTRLPRLRIRVYPNPVTINGLGFELKLSGDASSYRGEVYDIHGRRLNQFTAPANGRVVWDGRDEDGKLVRPGVYFVRAEGGGSEAVARVVLLR
jgi:ligand-binding sensor domain-containing protein